MNQVWNQANEDTSELSWVPIPGVGWMNCGNGQFELMKSLKDIREKRNMDIHSQTVQQVISEHYKKRKQFKRNKLRYRKSGGTGRALGWVPVTGQAIKWVNGQIFHNGHYFKVWDHVGLSQYKFKSGSFSEDSRGRWYLNICVEVEPEECGATSAVGVDLGLKDYATCSDGIKLSATQFYRNSQEQLAKAQRAGKKKLTRTIHAKIKNRRKDAIHKFTNQLTRCHAMIVVGDVSSTKLVKTKMAKSVYDAGWYEIKRQLKYKAIARSVGYLEVNESYTTQACSSCGCISDTSPKGRAGLGIREWTCAECGTVHDRDINAAKNILALGHGRLAGGNGT